MLSFGSTFQKCHGGAQPLQIYGRGTTPSTHPITTGKCQITPAFETKYYGHPV